MIKDDTIIFRWQTDRAEALRKFASKKGLTVSILLRNLLDNYLARLGLINNS